LNESRHGDHRLGFGDVPVDLKQVEDDVRSPAQDKHYKRTREQISREMMCRSGSGRKKGFEQIITLMKSCLFVFFSLAEGGNDVNFSVFFFFFFWLLS
jgi:hypothetical protein